MQSSGLRHARGIRMSEKRRAFFTFGFLFSIILVFSFADLVQGDRVFSETENKVLASKPKLTWESLSGGSYGEDYETYLTDQFVGRDKWITINTWVDIALQRKEIKGVYLAEDGYLIEQHLPEKYSAAREAEKLALLEGLVRRWDAMVMLAPTADNILTDKLPDFAPCYDERGLLEQAEALVGAENYVDVFTALKSHAGEEIYYRTDHHWTSLGAWYAYQAWAEAKGEAQDLYDRNSMEAVTQDFLGTLHSKVNLDMEGEAIYYFPQTAGQVTAVTYDLKDTRDTCYEESYLDTKNKYGFFLDDNHAFIEIETTCRNGKTLFVIKDSYANCLIPLLTAHYERIYVMDLRYFNGRLFQFMEKYEPETGMDVLVLYNCIHFLEEFAYLQ